MKRTIIINLFGGPGSGKSTVASGLFYTFKSKGLTCDNPYEFPKQVAWEDNKSQISDQLYILANQHSGVARSYGKVNYIILDSPLLLSLVYKNGYTGDYPAKYYNDSFDSMVLGLISSVVTPPPLTYDRSFSSTRSILIAKCFNVFIMIIICFLFNS